MIGLDTSLLLRFIVEDDPAQLARARRFITDTCTPRDPGLISVIVLCELVGVLESSYEFSKAEIIAAIEGLLRAPEFQFEDAPIVRATLGAYLTAKADLSDVLLGKRNRAAGCTQTATFDKAAAKLSEFALIA